jgi:hypothetical protein
MVFILFWVLVLPVLALLHFNVPTGSNVFRAAMPRFVGGMGLVSAIREAGNFAIVGIFTLQCQLEIH